MQEHITLLIRLGQIAGEPCSCEERASHALALLNAYTTRLYARIGIGTSNRLAVGAKSFADQTLADLRREILLAEVHAADPYRRIFTAVRHRIEMARRVLASRIVEGNATRSLAPNTDHVDAQVQSAHGLGDAVVPCRPARSGVAIEESLGLLEADTLRSALRLKQKRRHRPCRRARLGSLSGQLTI
jgi:hypothetical protein